MSITISIKRRVIISAETNDRHSSLTNPKCFKTFESTIQKMNASTLGDKLLRKYGSYKTEKAEKTIGIMIMPKRKTTNRILFTYFAYSRHNKLTTDIKNNKFVISPTKVVPP